MNDPSRAYAAATQLRFLEDFMRCYGVTESKATPCVHRLVKKRCTFDRDCLPPGADHTSMWKMIGEKKPSLIVTQPYDFDSRVFAEFVDWCRTFGVEASFGNQHSWHFPGATFAIMIATPDDWARLNDPRIREARRELRAGR
jgi:hypothetical protein